MEVRFRVHRYDPEIDVTPRYQVYTLEVDGDKTVLDCLNQIKWFQDGTVTFRRSCRSAICGACGMLINGRNRLACNTRVIDLQSPEVSVNPLPGFPILRDLVVDWDPFFAKDAAMKPYLINDTSPPMQERRQSPADYEKIDNATLCIMCGCCSSACPVVWNNGQYYGPAALTRAYRFIADSRDTAGAERLAIVGSEEGAWRCHTIFNCTSDCPKGVLNTQNIQALKRKVMLQNLGFGGSRMMFDINPPKPVPRSDATTSARNADSAGHRTH
jgi:succinate dehydrogenase / fumarate reductase iron-sulfur subunit